MDKISTKTVAEEEELNKAIGHPIGMTFTDCVQYPSHPRRTRGGE